MPPLPVRKNDHPRPRLPNHARHLQPVLPGILDAAVGKIERSSPTDAQNLCCVVGFAGTIFRCAARPHLSLRQVENARALPAPRRFQQRTSAGLLHVVAVSGNGKNVKR